MILLPLGSAAAHAASSKPAAFPQKRGKIVITVDLRSQKIWVDKYGARKDVLRVDGVTLPIVKPSIHAGRFRPSKIYNRFRTIGGNTYLENVIFFDGSHSIRTTRLFSEMLKAGRPVAGQVILEPDFGQIVFETVRAYGVGQTEIRIRK
jgi:hypothetical protein